MKYKVAILASLAMATTVLAIPTLPFPGWNEVKQKSEAIIVVQCVNTVDDPSAGFHGLINSDIQILSALKGSTNLGPAHLRSLFWPRKGEKYLIFVLSQENGVYDAIEKYRIIPLGTYVPPDLLQGKKLDEQVQILFQRRLNNLDQQMKEEQEEKQRLELEIIK